MDGWRENLSNHRHRQEIEQRHGKDSRAGLETPVKGGVKPENCGVVCLVMLSSATLGRVRKIGRQQLTMNAWIVGIIIVRVGTDDKHLGWLLVEFERGVLCAMPKEEK